MSRVKVSMGHLIPVVGGKPKKGHFFLLFVEEHMGPRAGCLNRPHNFYPLAPSCWKRSWRISPLGLRKGHRFLLVDLKPSLCLPAGSTVWFLLPSLPFLFQPCTFQPSSLILQLRSLFPTGCRDLHHQRSSIKHFTPVIDYIILRP